MSEKDRQKIDGQREEGPTPFIKSLLGASVPPLPPAYLIFGPFYSFVQFLANVCFMRDGSQ